MRHAGSIANRRRGQKAWKTRQNNAQRRATEIVDQIFRDHEERELGGSDVKRIQEATKDWTIERVHQGRLEELTFDFFYQEIKMWTEHPGYRDRRVIATAFGIMAGHSLSMALFEILLSGATIFTTKAFYKLRSTQ